LFGDGEGGVLGSGGLDGLRMGLVFFLGMERHGKKKKEQERN
jgi:hypothetical protein